MMHFLSHPKQNENHSAVKRRHSPRRERFSRLYSSIGSADTRRRKCKRRESALRVRTVSFAPRCAPTSRARNSPVLSRRLLSCSAVPRLDIESRTQQKHRMPRSSEGGPMAISKTLTRLKSTSHESQLINAHKRCAQGQIRGQTQVVSPSPRLIDSKAPSIKRTGLPHLRCGRLAVERATRRDPLHRFAAPAAS